ncbi:desulfoferrodoxin family protein [Treponema sp.]|uniref:desulfoferrodoxin family protein n=1 Tax=Treponema sp. TaxID=166 RepID=UPI00298DF964|nr:desulfoferrodoxin family protein [Treponema sp.]MCQ2242452.1 desulfoferrodoxin [Treponema sp.]
MEKRSELKFYYCKHCGKIIALVNDPGTPTICCGEVMQEMKPGTQDASVEKHVPVVKKDGCHALVSVGEVPHPMTTEHYIEWILLHTSEGLRKIDLTPQDRPEADFMLKQDEVVISSYEYCSIHKLWKGH